MCALTVLFAQVMLAETKDAYEDRLGGDFIEQTTFRFRTKFNRAFNDSDDFKTLVSRRIDVPPLLDGILEDDCWKVADHTKSAFIQWMTKEPVRKQTVIYVCHDDENLYMALVCEEPNLKMVRMASSHPGGKRRWATAGRGDHIETFIELGGVGGVGQVYQFIFNAYPAVWYDGLYPPFVPYIETGYKMAGAFGAKRWIVELSFPYDGFDTDKTDKVDFKYRGPPRRGEVWGLRMVRDGPKPDTGGERMRTTWTYNPTNSWHVPYPTGVIVFEHRNTLANGAFNEVVKDSDRPKVWRMATLGEKTKADLKFDDDLGHAVLSVSANAEEHGVQVTQKFGVLPNVGYKLTARVRKDSGEAKVFLGVDKPWLQHEFTKTGEWEDHVVDFFSDPGQREATVFIRLMDSKGSAAIDSISIEQQIYGAPTGAVCLTGNSPRDDTNLEKEKLAKVKYTYREPGTDKEEFPSRKQWTPGWIHGQPDIGGTTGWISATEGSLTHPDQQRKFVQWTHPRPTAGYVPYPKGHEIIFDLGEEYYVRSVELLPAAAIQNMTVSVRAEGGEEFVLSRKLRGAGVLNPPGPVLYGRIRRVNSVCRYVKIWFGDGGHASYFIRIWGGPKGEHKGISRFRWKEGLVVPEKKYRQFRKLEGPVLMPTPQEVEERPGEFVIKDGTRVYYRNGGRGEKVKDNLVDEVYAALGIRLNPILEKGDETIEDAKGAIVIGETFEDGLARKMAGAHGWKLDDKKPGIQGYYLASGPDGIVICGYDQAGTFYGVQTLHQLLIRRDESSASARGIEIRDWPYIPWRMLDCRGGLTLPMIRALARLKVNYVLGSRHPALEDYFMNSTAGYAGHSGGSPTEMADDENWHYLGTGLAGYMRINCCPSHYGRYEFYDGYARRVNNGGVVGSININTDEMDGTDGGSRWNADRRCLVRNKSGDELFTEMVLRAYDLFRLRNRKTALLDTMMVAGFEGGNGAYNDMYKAYDRIPEDMHVYCWRGITGDEKSDPEEAIRRFERTTMLQAEFPFPNRGRVNEYYKAPEGHRVWGTWNSVWGAAGPVDQVLTGQFCRSMTMVDGGSNIPFFCQAWNPNSPPVHTEEWALKIAHMQQRFGEIVLERELPSWRDGVKKDYFKIDMKGACNWSHIDPVPGDGKDWLDWGPNNDLRHLPRGDVEFEEVPFKVIDPKNNGGKSIVMVAMQSKNARLVIPNQSPEIPVGRPAASLIFLRTNLAGGNAPGYRITYTNGRYLTQPLDAMGNLSKKYACYGIYQPGGASRAAGVDVINFKSAKHRMTEYISLFFRPAWLGMTGAGDPLKVTLHEWVNPYPELAIKSVSVHYPPGRRSGRKEVLLAITGVAPTARDLALWKDRKRLPLVIPGTERIEQSDTAIIPDDGVWSDDPNLAGTYLDKEGNKVCELLKYAPYSIGSLFQRKDKAQLRSGAIIKLTKPVVAKKIAIRAQFYWEYFGPKVHYGVSMFRRTDCIIQVSTDGKNWTTVGENKAICGEDGAYVHRLPATPFHYIRPILDARPYLHRRNPNGSMGPGLTWVQVYR